MYVVVQENKSSHSCVLRHVYIVAVKSITVKIKNKAKGKNKKHENNATTKMICAEFTVTNPTYKYWIVQATAVIFLSLTHILTQACIVFITFVQLL